MTHHRNRFRPLLPADELARCFDSGMSVVEVAAMAGCSERTVPYVADTNRIILPRERRRIAAPRSARPSHVTAFKPDVDRSNNASAATGHEPANSPPSPAGITSRPPPSNGYLPKWSLAKNRCDEARGES